VCGTTIGKALLNSAARSTEQNGLSQDMAQAVRGALLCGQNELLQSDAEKCYHKTILTVLPECDWDFGVIFDRKRAGRENALTAETVATIEHVCHATFLGGLEDAYDAIQDRLKPMIWSKEFNGIDVPSLVVDVIHMVSGSLTPGGDEDWFGNQEALTYSSLTFYANPYRSPRRKKEQHPNADAQVWSLILNTTMMPPIPDPCSFGRHGFGRVACQLDVIDGPPKVRLRALTLQLQQKLGAKRADSLFRATHQLMGLKYLHMDLPYDSVPSKDEEVEFRLPGGPSTVALYLSGPTQWLWNLVVTEADTIRLKHLRYLAIGPDEEGPLLSGEQLAPLCKLRSLWSLNLAGNLITSLPACFGDLIELRLLDVRSARLQHRNALPPELSKLVNLRHLIVFGQGETLYESPASSCTKRSDCMPSYTTILGERELVGDGNLNEWQCGSLVGDVDDLPVFGMARLERLWLDMNNLTMSPDFLERAVQAWPKLRTLDLYSNNIKVDVNVVQKLKQLPQLHQLLLHNNNLHGKISGSFFEGWPRSWQTLNLGLNREITGCLHPHDIPQQLEIFNHGGTKLVVSEACDKVGVDRGTSTQKRCSSTQVRVAKYFEDDHSHQKLAVGSRDCTVQDGADMHQYFNNASAVQDDHILPVTDIRPLVDALGEKHSHKLTDFLASGWAVGHDERIVLGPDAEEMFSPPFVSVDDLSGPLRDYARIVERVLTERHLPSRCKRFKFQQVRTLYSNVYNIEKDQLVNRVKAGKLKGGQLGAPQFLGHTRRPSGCYASDGCHPTAMHRDSSNTDDVSFWAPVLDPNPVTQFPLLIANTSTMVGLAPPNGEEEYIPSTVSGSGAYAGCYDLPLANGTVKSPSPSGPNVELLYWSDMKLGDYIIFDGMRVFHGSGEIQGVLPSTYKGRTAVSIEYECVRHGEDSSDG